MRISCDRLTSLLLDVALGLGQRERGPTTLDDKLHLYEALDSTIAELRSWGLDLAEDFRKQPPGVPDFYWDFLKQEDGSGVWLESGVSIDDVFLAMHGHYQNLILLRDTVQDGDLQRARKFCLLLHQHVCAEIWEGIHERRGLVAA